MLLNQDVIAELKMIAGDAPEVLLEIIDAYLSQLPDFIEGIYQGVSLKEHERLNQAAHGLKGSSFNIGAQQLGELCSQLEHYAREQNFASAAALLKELGNVSAATQAELQALKTGI